MTNKTSTLQDEVTEVIDLVVYLQLMGSFIPNSNFKQIKDIVTSTNDFIRDLPETEIKEKLPVLKIPLQKMAQFFMDKFPLKRKLREIAVDFNSFFKDGNPVYNTGLAFGWLNEQMDLNDLQFYADTPYHFRIGLGPHRGNGSIEEDFLLKDAFNTRVRAEYYQNLLSDFGNRLKENKKNGLIEFDQELYTQITAIKFQVSAYSRLTIISFYAFIEGFVNSVGHSYLTKNEKLLNEKEVELLKGFKKGRYLQLKSKVEKFQTIIRTDKKVKIVVSDDRQITEPFKTFFDYYEELRNAAMHYSPIKENIWMKPQEWLNKAIEFSKQSTMVALEFWKACYPTSDGPEYLGKLDYDLHLEKGKKRIANIEQIENERKNWQ